MTSQTLAEALVSELRIRESKVAKENASIAIPQDIRSFTRAKVEPMVRGLFKIDERELVLSLLEVSVEFVTVERYRRKQRFSRWNRCSHRSKFDGNIFIDDYFLFL